MSNQTTTRPAQTQTDAERAIAERLAQIAAAIEKAKTAGQPAPDGAKNKAFACPIDPAERAACDGCQ